MKKQAELSLNTNKNKVEEKDNIIVSTSPDRKINFIESLLTNYIQSEIS